MDCKQDSIQVFIRVKPGEQEDTLVFSETEIKLDRHQFAFDKIFSPQSTQDDIFDAVGHRLLCNTLDGYHGCVFVYGQTGSGKTYTMIGEDNGLMQKSFRELFIRLDSLANSQCFVTCSYFELYNEQILDLLDPKKDKKLSIRQDTKKGIYVQNLLEETALASGKLFEMLQIGMKNRHVGQTMMNRESSRSHSVFTISLSCRIQDSGKKVLMTPKLHFVDLAGSERQKLTSATGDRLKEAGNINKSLTTLGMVINALTSDKPRTHIPYRDSKLTCLLRDSLGGNSKTYIIATVASSVVCFQETLSTLNFANRAKMVKVRALINEESLSTNIDSFKEQIKRLRQQIVKLRSQKKHSDKKQSLNNPQNIDFHFQEINNKISVISEQLTRNSVSPAFETIIEKLQSARIDKNQINDMIGEEEEEEQTDVLMDYLNSNYQLLSQVNQKVNDYLHMKHELRMTAISGKLSVDSLRSPTKGERTQYDETIAKKDIQNKQMHNDVLSMREQLTDRELKILELQQKLRHVESSQKSESEVVSSYRQSLYSRQKELLSFKSKIIQLEENFQDHQHALNQHQSIQKQLRELYHFAEQKLQGETYLRSKLESQYKSVATKADSLESQVKNLKDKHQVELDFLKSNLQSLEGSEEELKREIAVLQQTVEFHQKKANQYSQRNKTLEISNEKLVKSIKSLSLQKTEIQERIIQMELKISSMEQIMVELEKQNKKDLQRIKLVQNSKNSILSEFDQYRKEAQNQTSNFKLQIQQHNYTIQELNQRILTLQQTITRNLEEINHYRLKFVEVEKLRKDQSQYLMGKIEEHINIQEQIMVSKNQLECLVVTLNQKVNSQIQQLAFKGIQVQELLEAFEATKTIRQQNQQLRKSYQAVIKQNYRLKAAKDGKYENSQQMFSKVQYYEEKFKLMSMQYKKATQTVKRLKERELQQSKVIHNLQQHAKAVKFSRNTLQLEEAIKVLEQENSELKKKLPADTTGSKLLSEVKNTISTNSTEEQKQQLLRKKLQDFIVKWGSKQGQPEKMNFDQLIQNWEKIECECRRKLESIAQGIQRQQKLKSQNNFILKQNIYLKQKLNSIEKELQLSSSKPRKIPKGNTMFSCSE